MATHPIPENTVNRTANISTGIDRRLGRLAGNLKVSKSEVIRRLVESLLNGAIHVSQLGLTFLLATSLGLVIAAGFKPETDFIRAGRPPAVRVQRGRRNRSPLIA